MDYMYGQLYKQIKEIEYKGRNSETTVVTVDQKTKTIRVDVKILSPEQLLKDEGNYVLLVEIDEDGKHALKWVSTQSTLDRIKELEDKTYKLTYNKDTDTSTFDSNVTINKDLNVEGIATIEKGAEISEYLSVPNGSIWAGGEIKANYANPAVSLKPFDDRAGIRFSDNASTDNYVDIVHYGSPTGRNELLVPDKSGTLSTVEDIPARVLTETITELVPKTTIVFAEDTDHNTGLYVSGKDVITFVYANTNDIINGNCKYIITWDDIDYVVYEEQFSAPRESEDIKAIYYDWQNIGNANNDILKGYSPATKNLPFTITQDRWENAGEILIYAIGSTATQHTISVKRVTGTYKRLTPEYYYDGYAYLRRSKETTSAHLGLNEVELRTSFAVGDGNKLNGNGGTNIVVGGGNRLIDAISSAIFGSFNEVNGNRPGNIVTGANNNINNVQSTAVFGQGNSISKESNVGATFISGYKNVIGDPSQTEANDITAPSISILGYSNKLISKKATVGDQTGSTGAVTIIGNDNDVKETAISSAFIGNANTSTAIMSSSVILGNRNNFTKTADNVFIGNSMVIGTQNTVSNDVAQAHISGDANTVDNKNNVYIIGRNNTADMDHQYIMGKYSAPDDTAVYKFGYGTKDAPKNLFTLHEDGSGTLIGAPQNENDIARLKELNTKVTRYTAPVINERRAYVVNPSGWDETVPIHTNALGDDLPIRTGTGQLKANDGIEDSDLATIKQLNAGLNAKLDLTGGTLTGNLTIQDADVEIIKTVDGKGNLTVGGNLRVNGTTTTVDTETLAVKDNLIVTNSSNAELVNLSGLAIKTGNKDANENAIAYGILYDPATSADSVKLGLGSINRTTNEFTFKTAMDANPVATRDDSTKLKNNHLLVWNSDKHTLMDANNLVDSVTPASLGLTNFVLDGGEITA